MNDNLTEIGVVIDESGSMGHERNDVIGGFNTFLDDQLKLDGKANLSLTKFNSSSETIYEGVDLKGVKPLDEDTYRPGGMTALYDAIGSTIDSIGTRLAGMKEKERPGKVIIVIMTDGDENSSREYDYTKVKNMITKQQDQFKWEFVFLGAGIDAMKAGGSLGIHTSANAIGANDSYTMASAAVRSYRCNGKVDLNN